MATCVVSGTIKDVQSVGISGVNITAKVIKAVLSTVDNTIYVPRDVTVTTDANGAFSLTLQQALDVIFVVSYPPTTTDARRSAAFTATIPSTSTANFASIILVE